MVTTSSASTSLKDYLKKYETSDNVEKKRKKKKPKTVGTGVLVVDEDPVWQKPVNLEEEEDEPEGEPQVEVDINVKYMKRLEMLSKVPYNQISEDGSGWVSVTDTQKCSTSDVSPPRSRRARYDTPSPEAGRNPSDRTKEEDDLSPPRPGRRRNDSLSPSPRGEREASDLSPPRQQRRVKDSPSPQLDSNSLKGRVVDLSPPRKRGRRFDSPSPEPNTKASDAGYNSDLSPPRRRGQGQVSPVISRKKSVPDLSPPRQRRRRYDSPSPEPNTKASDAGYNSDLSPPRRRGQGQVSPSPVISRKKSVPDLSPPRQRRRRYDSPSPGPNTKASNAGYNRDLSPPRRRGQSQVSPSPVTTKKSLAPGENDLSPPRRERSFKLSDSRGSEDLSPPRKSQKGIDKTSARDSSAHRPTEVDLSPPRKRSVEKKTGLITGKDVSKEIAKTKKDDLARFDEMDASASGRGAEPTYRIDGKQVSKDEYLKKKTKKKEKPKEDKKLEWGKGLAQKREAEAKLQELELEKAKPFARSRDDADLDKMMKDRLRWGDPMAHLVKSKQSDLVLPDLGGNEKMKESGFIVPQDIPSHSWIKRRIDFEPNRYGIKPGRHWDGVNRSTGYEKQLVQRTNEKKATQREAYLYSVSDM